jgi:3-oxoacyl-[acyl-carrier protein] reductase
VLHDPSPNLKDKPIFSFYCSTEFNCDYKLNDIIFMMHDKPCIFVIKKNMVAVISGATKGIGKALAFAFAELGFDLALGARGEEGLEKIKHLLHQKHPNIKTRTFITDFSLKKSIEDFSDSVKKEFESIDVLINNVGMYSEGTVSTEPNGLLEKNMQLNLYSAYYLSRAFIQDFKLKKSGHIFNICSVLSETPRKEASAYTISKFALLGFNKVLAEEMREYHVKVTALLPGSVNTSSWDGIKAPKEQFVQPEDIASAVITAYQTSKNAFIEEITIKPLNPTL